MVISVKLSMSGSCLGTRSWHTSIIYCYILRTKINCCQRIAKNVNDIPIFRAMEVLVVHKSREKRFHSVFRALEMCHRHCKMFDIMEGMTAYCQFLYRARFRASNTLLESYLQEMLCNGCYYINNTKLLEGHMYFKFATHSRIQHKTPMWAR